MLRAEARLCVDTWQPRGTKQGRPTRIRYGLRQALRLRFDLESDHVAGSLAVGVQMVVKGEVALLF